MLAEPFPLCALYPTAVLLSVVVTVTLEFTPNDVFPSPVVIAVKESVPTAVL